MAKPRRKPQPKEWSRTFQLRLKGEYGDLDDVAVRYNGAKRTTYGQAKLRQCSFDDLKVELSDKFSLPSRTFNSIGADLKGMVKSRQEKSAVDADDLAEKLERVLKDEAKARERVAKAITDNKSTQRRKNRSTAVRKKESADRLRARLDRARSDMENPFPSICFGSRKLLNAQHHLEANRYGNHGEWLSDWRSARSDQFLIVGSEDEASGNKTCRGRVNEDGTVNLRLLLTKEDANGQSRSVVLDGLRLPYGHDVWEAAIEAGDEEAKRSRTWQKATGAEVERMKAAGELTPEAEAELRKQRKAERKKQSKVGAAIAYRFVKDGYGWRILVTITRPMPTFMADFSRGGIGIDLNDGFVSRARVDADGLLVDCKDVALTIRGLSSGQRLAAIHDLADLLVKEALVLGLPIVIEWLNFTLKKRRLREVGCDAASRRLSSFAYAKFAEVLKSHARLHGVCVVEVNPAFTSVIGAALHAVPMGLSVHGAAAMTIARRAMGVEETVPETMRVWHPHRAPLPMQRPECLRRKAPVDPAWEGWKELQNAVHAAREAVKCPRQTGKERRQDKALQKACYIPY